MDTSKEYLDEAFWDKFKQGFQTQYQASSQTNKTPEQDYEKFKNIAIPAVQKVQGAAKALSDKYKIPLPLCISLLAAGAAGGFGALPGAVALFYTRKMIMNPVMKGASAAFDAGVRTFQPQQPPPLPTESFKQWLELQEAWFDNKFGDWTGNKLGQATGFLAGKTAKYAGKVKNVIDGSWNELKQFVSQNKLSIGKAAYMLGIGALVGAGVGYLSDQATHAVMDALKGHTEIPETELNQLSQDTQPNANATQPNATPSAQGLPQDRSWDNYKPADYDQWPTMKQQVFEKLKKFYNGSSQAAHYKVSELETSNGPGYWNGTR